MRKPALILIVLAAALALSWSQGWLRLPAEDVSKDTTPSATAKRDLIESKLMLSGEVTPAFQVEVKSEVSGKVKKIHVVPGQRVSKGDLLATIDDTDLLNEKASAETEIEGARLALNRDKGNYDRAKALFEQKLISREVYSNIEANFRISENSLEKGERKLQTVIDKIAKTRIPAPADGTILDVMINEGQVVVAAASVNSGTSLMLFADVSRLLINTHVNQVDASQLAVGQEILLRTRGGDDEPDRARIEFIAPIATVKNNIKGFEVQAELANNKGRLKPGMSVSMDVPINRAEDVVTVPVSAIFREKDGKVVYVRKGAQVERRSVSVGITDLSRAEIKSGLDEGEEILLVPPVTEAPHGKS